MDRATALRWRHRDHPLGRFGGGPVHRTDLGPPRLSRLADDHVVGSVTTRTHPDRWGALTLTLRSDTRRWSITDLQRVLAANHYRTSPRTPPVEVPLDRQLSQLTADRRLAHAALTATTRRLDELPRTDPARHPTAQMVRTWRSLATRLDRDLTALQARHHATSLTEPPLRR